MRFSIFILPLCRIRNLSMENPKCYHCGEDCGRHPVVFNNKNFCCHGCKSVYQILGDGELYKYYELENSPGTKIDQERIGDKYAYLDTEEIQQQLLDFDDGQIAKVSFFVPNIHCASCIWLLENMQRLDKNISISTVNFVKKTVFITFRKNEISLRRLAELLDSVGYPPKISLEDTEKDASKTNKKLYYQIGITGFAFGNIMLMSFPEYLSGGQFTHANFPIAFSWLNLILSIPVAFYSANDYYISAWKGLLHKHINIDVPIAIGIIVLFLRTAYEVVTQTGAGYADSLAGLLFFLLVGKWYQNKTYQALSFERDYKSYFPIAVTRITEGKEEIIPLKKLKKGDRILVRNQELIPADAQLKKGLANIDFSFVTGEATPVRKAIDDTIFAGGRQKGSSIELEIQKEVEQSYLTQLWNQDGQAKEQSRLTSIVDKVSQYFTLSILILAIITGLYWFVSDSNKAIPAFTAVLIVACPCALALSLPFSFGTTMRIFGRKGFYLKKVEVVEKLTKLSSIVFDKTGTITQSNAVSAKFNGEELNPNQLLRIKSIARHSTHPMSVAVSGTIGGDDFYAVENYKESMAQGIEAEIDSIKYKIGAEKFVTGQHNIENGLATKVFVSENEKQLGYFKVENKYRPGLKKTIDSLEKRYQLYLLTGDNEGEKENLLQFFSTSEKLNFNQKPDNKLNFIRKLKEKGENVLMIGDGLNDAGALNESNTGISIADNVYHFSPACDAILESKQFNKLADFIRFSRTSLSIVKISYGISFLYNIIGLSFAVSGQLSPIVAAILMPISSVTVVAFVTLSTHYLAKRKLDG